MSNLTVLYFSADWCGPCQGFKPKLTQLTEDNRGKFTLEMVNVDTERDRAVKLGIRSVPTAVFMQDGVEVKRASGVTPIEKALTEITLDHKNDSLENAE